MLPAAGAVTETEGGVVSQASVPAMITARVDLFPLESTASTPIAVEALQGRPVTFQVVAVVVPTDSPERKTSYAWTPTLSFEGSQATAAVVAEVPVWRRLAGVDGGCVSVGPTDAAMSAWSSLALSARL